MSGARAYSRREDVLIRDVCGQARPVRIRTLKRELGRSETGIRRRWQRLLRGGGPAPGPTGPEAIHALAREADFLAPMLRSVATGLYLHEPDANDRLVRLTGAVRSLGAEVGLLTRPIYTDGNRGRSPP